jgi:hypothetical protein
VERVTVTARRTAQVGLLGALLALTGLVAAAAPTGAAEVGAAQHPVQMALQTVAVPSAVSARGHDVSYPQCGGALPSSGEFGLVGVDGGRPFAVNPCLADQIAWARTFGRPQYYANTANPGPRLSSHWPIGQHGPRACTKARPDSAGCAYDYGVNVAKSSFARARAAARSIGAKDPVASTWWLDVELHNTWEADEFGPAPKYLRNDVAALAGMVHALHRKGVRHIGVYSTAHQWGVVTGGASLGRAPVWSAGTGSQANARIHCRPTFSFTGGPIRMAQYATNGFDGDLRCG